MRCFRAIVCASVALGLASCAKVPQDAVDTALSKVAAAERDTDIVTYAPDSLRAAQEKLDSLRVQIAAQEKKSALTRNYDLTTTLASEAAEAAARSVEDAAAAKRQVRDEAAALLSSMSETILNFEKKVASARRVRGIKLDFTSLISTSQQIRVDLADAQKDFDAGAFAAAHAKAMALQDRIADAEETISEAMLLAKKR
jgi:hypothetical protein